MNPENLPKVRSEALLAAVEGMPCTLRIASLIPGLTCAPAETVVPCHLPVFGKGWGTKVSDLYVAAGCRICHDLLDGRDPRWAWLADTYAAAVMQRQLCGLCETLALLIAADIIQIKGATIIEIGPSENSYF